MRPGGTPDPVRSEIGMRGDGLTDMDLVDAIEQIVIAGVAMTNASLSRSRQGPDLTFPQWRVLVVLGRRPEGMPVHEIARLIHVTLPATSRQLRRLAQRGFVVFDPDQTDRRVTRARLSEAGIAVRDSIMSDRRSLIEAAIADLRTDRHVTDAVAGIAARMQPREADPPQRQRRGPSTDRSLDGSTIA
jgi:DNA-binding MarR family transcriptional regulator